MATKPEIASLASTSRYSTSGFNDRFNTIKNEFENVLGRDGLNGENNTMRGDLDMGFHRIRNLAAPVLPTDAARLQDITGGVGPGGTSNILSVTSYGAVGDGVTDDTSAVQTAVNAAAGRSLYFPYGTYVIDSISVTASIDIVCDNGVKFLRKANADVSRGDYSDTGAAMFEIETNGVTFVVSDFEYDGNNSNQTAAEPTGFFVRIKPPTSPGAEPITAFIRRGKFVNGTSGYLFLRGDNFNKRYETFVYVDDCRFYDTIKGKGKGDPTAPALGNNPTYVLVMDYVRLRTLNFHAQFDASTGTGEYAPTALNGTFHGVSYANSGESHIYMHGTTYLKNMGRSAKKWNDDTDWITNNGIGAIDMYGNADTLFVENVVAIDCQNVPVRAKGSIKNYTVLNANLVNCHRGLQVGPSSTGPCETVVYVGALHSDGGTIPQFEMIGNSSSEPLFSVKIDSIYLEGTFTNPENLNIGMVRARYVDMLHLTNVTVGMSVYRGVEILDVKFPVLDNINVSLTSSSGEGIYISGGINVTLDNFFTSNTAGAGVSIAANPDKCTIRNGYISQATNYGVFSNTTTTDLLVENVFVVLVSGTSRGFYAGGGDVTFIKNRTTSVTTPLFVVAGTNKREEHNYWNAVINYAASAPAAGTWKVGDLVYNTNPTAGGTVGWICTTAGTPGTWKTFGSIAA